MAISGAPDCVVFGRSYDPDQLEEGREVFIAVRPEDVEIMVANGDKAPSGMTSGTATTALFIGERIEYEVEVDGQGNIQVYGDRHEPAEEGGRVWLRIRPEGHSVWASDWSHVASVDEDP